MIDERIDLYIKLAAINKIKAYIKCKFNKIFKEYDEEVDRYLLMVKMKSSLVL